MLEQKRNAFFLCFSGFLNEFRKKKKAEIFLNLYALRLLSSQKFKAASVTALVASAMTSSKTILYHVMEISCDGCNTKQNDWATFLTLYVLPNGVWIWVPMYACYVLGNSLCEDNKDDALVKIDESSNDEEEEQEQEEVVVTKKSARAKSKGRKTSAKKRKATPKRK